MKINHQHRAGFTLIEIIATIALSGIVLVFATMLIETSTKIFIGSKNAAQDSQKIQMAMNRMVKELTFAKANSVEITNGRFVEWISGHPDRSGKLGNISWNGTTGSDLEFITSSGQNFPLLDNVSSFSISSAAGAITITLQTRTMDVVEHTVTIHPRYDL